MSLSAFVASCCLLVCGFARADVPHHLFRKIAVFPIADTHVASSEDAWWLMRETLTKKQRFLVASRRFMINRGVFQARRELKPADVIILGKILDAEALMTTVLEDRTLKMEVYNAEDGSTFWRSRLELHPALPVADQLTRAVQKLVQDFLLALPYQGFQVVDEVVGRPVFEVGDQKHAWIFHGVNSGLEVGDPVQWVDVRGQAGVPFFNSLLSVQVIAEGRVVQVRGNEAEVAVLKARSLADLGENSLIRFPKEMERLKSQYAPGEKGAALSSEYLTSEMKSASELEKGHSSTATALAFIGNLAVMLLLAL